MHYLPELLVSYLHKKRQLELNEWMQYLSDKADEQYKQMNSKQRGVWTDRVLCPRQPPREDMINAYIQISQEV